MYTSWRDGPRSGESWGDLVEEISGNTGLNTTGLAGLDSGDKTSRALYAFRVESVG